MNFKSFKLKIKNYLPKPIRSLYSSFYNRDIQSVIAFLFNFRLGLSMTQRLYLVKQMYLISNSVECPHSHAQIIEIIKSLVTLPEDLSGCIVEAGSFKGGSTAKLSIIAKLLKREFIVFDSFEGLPDNNEDNDYALEGHCIKGWFKKGDYLGTLEEVKHTIEKFGEISVCNFQKGWFTDTMPNFSEKICAIFIDVDLAESTKTCLKYLYPHLVPGGILFSHDGAFPTVIEVFKNDAFWENEVGCKKPNVDGLGERRLIKIVKPDHSNEPS